MWPAFTETGRFTSTPRWIIGAVTMKMMSSTSITSTSGTTLISASELDTRLARPRPGAAASCPVATLGTLREVPFCDVQKLHREVVHFRCEDLHPVGEHVVEVHRRDRRDESERRRDQRVRNRTRYDAKVRGSSLRDVLKGDHDADDRAEEPDKRRDRGRRPQKTDVFFKSVDLDARCAQQCAIHPREA